MNELQADEKADRDVAVGEARFEAAERARAAEVRLEDAANEVRREDAK
nr:hypothetical protein [uncultured Sphingosinicella sp.]